MQSELIRFVASYKPLIASAKVSERIITIIKYLLLCQMPAQVWLQTLVYMIYSIWSYSSKNLLSLELPDLQNHFILILEMTVFWYAHDFLNFRTWL
jgi:hypothetical protein